MYIIHFSRSQHVTKICHTTNGVMLWQLGAVREKTVLGGRRKIHRDTAWGLVTTNGEGHIKEDLLNRGRLERLSLLELPSLDIHKLRKEFLAVCMLPAGA